MWGGISVGRIGIHFSDDNFLGLRVVATRCVGLDVQRRLSLRLQRGGFRCRCSTQAVPEDLRVEKRTLVVVGGGAAGVFGALRAKSLCPSLEVLVLEKGQLLSKVRISGGGRCNLTTGLFNDPSLLAGQYPRGHKELRGSYFHVHGPEDTAAWFVRRGVALKILTITNYKRVGSTVSTAALLSVLPSPIKTESDGRMFPKSNSSATIIDCLLNEARRIGVTLQTNALVNGVSKKGDVFNIQMGGRKSDGKNILETNYVLLATGSAFRGYQIALQLGHSIVEPMPSLFTFRVRDNALTELSGVSFERVKVELELPDQRLNDPHWTQDGPLLITHWGVSGPVVLRLSAWAARHLYSSGYEGILWVDFLPNFGLEETQNMLVKHKQECQKRNLGSFVPTELRMVRRFWLYLLQRQGLDRDSKWARLPTKSLYDLAALIKRCSFKISGKRVCIFPEIPHFRVRATGPSCSALFQGEFKDEFVTAGGVPLVEVDLKTMESRKSRGLFLAGEVLDVDGITGGFNFQNAWTGGFIAGTTIAEQIGRAKTLVS